ncbi:PLP-dependent aminotransferase family protein [Adlercreutzia sp. R21]|uniref:MocR-like pyridoxine biosynthesis transcription factor PdxR n=1 Tax=Adlercreutzia wanghongyangiae TaxID=3111451 RepID=UPI002DB63B0B|nr:PLP-dependent aminotransferase family protein [Adlercreutzia sp. R21]MEC4185282.1 PLP-dependent aminotransferase family protein [Adlercreutzia sp. R21]
MNFFGSGDAVCGTNAVCGTEWLADFTGATAPEGLFPYAAWARTLRRVLADESERTVLQAAGSQGSPRLRAAIAAHLRGFRGMEVHPDQIIVGSGAQSLYGLLVQLLGRGLVYGVENPGYPRLVRIYRSNDVRVAMVPVDDAGPMPAALTAAGVDVLHCMPSHQFPLGTTTPVGRRQELLTWARGDGQDAGGRRYLIEDDFDCEFRMTGRPVPPLAALDGAERVVYANTFTKTLGAAFRIGYVVLPWELAARFRDQLGFYACTVGALEQLTLARFMESGDYERHVNRQRTYFRRLQNALVEALGASEAAEWLRLRNVGAGLHFLMEVQGVPAADARVCERAMVECAAARGVRLAPLSDYRTEGASDAPAFVMSFASLAEERAPEVAAVIATAMREMLSR